MKSVIVTSYKNPDLDGVASMIALADYLATTLKVAVSPIVFGVLDLETIYVLDLLGIGHPRIVSECPHTDTVYLVDTHHLRQIKGTVAPESVVQIYDHHPSGDPDAFPYARIVNEQVGAVATIIAELFRSGSVPVEGKICALLYAGIVSNTLNFTAPTTTGRDLEITQWLYNQSMIPESLAAEMFAARSNYSGKTTDELLARDYKEFGFSGISVGISQIEGVNVKDILFRPELGEEIARLRSKEGANHCFLSLVDISEKKTYLVSDQQETRQILSEAIGATFSNQFAEIGRILLRKSDLIPLLEACLGQRSSV